MRHVDKAPDAAIVKVGAQWGLASWWPKGVFAASAPVRGAKKKHKKTRPNTTASEPMPVREKKDMPVGERIIQMLAGRPGTEFAHEHIADSLQANRQITQMVLAKLVKTGKIDTTASGKYRAVVAKQSAVS